MFLSENRSEIFCKSSVVHKSRLQQRPEYNVLHKRKSTQVSYITTSCRVVTLNSNTLSSMSPTGAKVKLKLFAQTTSDVKHKNNIDVLFVKSL